MDALRPFLDIYYFIVHDHQTFHLVDAQVPRFRLLERVSKKGQVVYGLRLRISHSLYLDNWN